MATLFWASGNDSAVQGRSLLHAFTPLAGIGKARLRRGVLYGPPVIEPGKCLEFVSDSATEAPGGRVQKSAGSGRTCNLEKKRLSPEGHAENRIQHNRTGKLCLTGRVVLESRNGAGKNPPGAMFWGAPVAVSDLKTWL